MAVSAEVGALDEEATRVGVAAQELTPLEIRRDRHDAVAKERVERRLPLQRDGESAERERRLPPQPLGILHGDRPVERREIRAEILVLRAPPIRGERAREDPRDAARDRARRRHNGIGDNRYHRPLAHTRRPQRPATLYPSGLPSRPAHAACVGECTASRTATTLLMV